MTPHHPIPATNTGIALDRCLLGLTVLAALLSAAVLVGAA